MKPLQLFINIIVIALFTAILIYVFMDKTHANQEWTENTYKKNAELVSLGFNPTFTVHLINECKNSALDPVRCIKIGASIAGAESSKATRCYRNNCVGMNDGAVAYTSVNEGMKAWVGKYNKWWYKQKNPSGFYRDDGSLPPTRYCMGKNKDGVCKE